MAASRTWWIDCNAADQVTQITNPSGRIVIYARDTPCPITAVSTKLAAAFSLLFHMLAAIGEFERDLIKERAAEGIARAAASVRHPKS